MRIVSGVAMLALGLSVGCAGKTGTPQTAGSQPAATATAAGGAGAQAAARVTPEQLEAAMKTISTTGATLRKNLMSNQLMDAAKDAQLLATTFGEVERFWMQNNKPDAVKLAQQARQGATEAAGAAAAGDAMKANTAANDMQATCKQCHGLYREGDAQTGFRIKAGTLTQ